MKKENTLLECQKDFLFNSEYKYGHLNENEKLLYSSCKQNDKGVGAYVGEISKDDCLVIYKDIFKLILSCCEDCEHHI